VSKVGGGRSSGVIVAESPLVDISRRFSRRRGVTSLLSKKGVDKGRKKGVYNIAERIPATHGRRKERERI